jgi:hypothetical protein
MGYTSLFDFDDWYSILDDHFIVICGGPASERAVLFMKRQNVLFLSVEQFSVCNYSILLLNQCLIWVLVMMSLNDSILCIDIPSNFRFHTLNFINTHFSGFIWCITC